MQYHVNGDLVPADEATVSIRDRGFRYGDAAFETLRVYGGDPFRWGAHRDRLLASCASLGMAEAVPGDLRDRVDETLRANDLREAYVRVAVTRGVQPGTLDPKPVTDPTVVVEVADLPRGGVAGESVWDDPATLSTSGVKRPPDAVLPADAKTHNYLPNILARQDVDADEALLLDGDGHVTEGAASNVFVVRDGVLHTPALDGPVLPGITRAVVLELAEESGVPFETGTYGPEAVRTADEIFLTNSTWEVRPVGSVDGEAIAEWPTTLELARAFDGLVERTHYE